MSSFNVSDYLFHSGILYCILILNQYLLHLSILMTSLILFIISIILPLLFMLQTFFNIYSQEMFNLQHLFQNLQILLNMDIHLFFLLKFFSLTHDYLHLFLIYFNQIFFLNFLSFLFLNFIINQIIFLNLFINR